MSQSYIEKKMEVMKALLWDNILEEFVRINLPIAVGLIPWAGPFLFKVFSVGLFQDLVVKLIHDHIAEPLLLIMTRFGIFTSIDWQNSAVYRAYEVEAEKLIPLQDKEVWSEDDRKKFRDAARKLIRFNIRK